MTERPPDSAAELQPLSDVRVAGMPKWATQPVMRARAQSALVVDSRRIASIHEVHMPVGEPTSGYCYGLWLHLPAPAW